MRHRWTGALAVSLAVSGCDGPVGPADRLDLVVSTDKAEYSLAADSVSRVTLTNRSDRAVYLPMSTYVVYETLRDGVWQDALPWFGVDGVGISFPLSPGESRGDDLSLRVYLPDQPGTYRFRYFAYADARLRFLIPVEERVSPPITIAR